MVRMCSEGEIQRHTSFPCSVRFHNFRSNKLLLHELIKLWNVFIPVSINQQNMRGLYQPQPGDRGRLLGRIEREDRLEGEDGAKNL